MKKVVTLGALLIVGMFIISCTTMGVSKTMGADAPIGIISAMTVEIEYLLTQADIDRVEEIGGVEYHVGRIAGKDIVLVQAGIGKALAAAGTATLINEFNVSSIIFTGIAGGVADETSITDVVISTALVTHDYGDETNDGFVWEPNAGIDETGLIPADAMLIEKAYEAAVLVCGEDKVFKGVIATGDQFVASESTVRFLQEKFNAYATEMEGSSIARVAYQYGVPYVVIRSLSDKADGAAHDAYDNWFKIASDNSGKIVISLLESL